VKWKNGDATSRVVDMRQLVLEIESAFGAGANSFTSANFALQMTGGVEMVRFPIQS